MFYLVESEIKVLSKVTKDDIPIEPEPEVKEKPLGFLQSLFTRKSKYMLLFKLIYLVLMYSVSKDP